MKHDFTNHSTKSLIELANNTKKFLDFCPLFRENKLDLIYQIKNEIKRRSHE